MEREQYDEHIDNEHLDAGACGDEEVEAEKSSKHRGSKESKKSSTRGEDRDHHRSRDRERGRDREKEYKDAEKDRVQIRDKRKDVRDDREKDKDRREKTKEKDYDRDKYREKEREREKERKDRGKEKEREREKDVEKERGKDKSKDRDREREKERDRAKEKEVERHKDRDRERESDRHRDREKGRDRAGDKERERGDDHQDKERSRDRDRINKKSHEVEESERGKDGHELDYGESILNGDGTKEGRVPHHSLNEADDVDGASGAASVPASELEERILKMKEERLKKKPESNSEILAWINKSRKIEEKKKTEKEKALQLSKILEEQDAIVQAESDEEEVVERNAYNLSGVKVTHGLDKVMEGGAVVLTLKDQHILAGGDINEEADVLENVEIGEQKRRDDAYKAAKKKIGTYDDKFNDVPGSEKKILPQYDDPLVDEGVTLDERGRISSEAERKLEELRKRLQGASTSSHIEDLNSSVKVSSDYFTQEEMLKFRKPKKKKALRKKDKLDIDALEAEAVASGLGVGDLGSRNDGMRQAKREDQERSEAETRNIAYQSAYEKAEEASKLLYLEQSLPDKVEQEENIVIADDEDELYKSLERARRLALKKQKEELASGPQAIARLAASTVSSQTADDQNLANGEGQDKIVFTEVDEFVWGLQLDEEARKPEAQDVFMDEDIAPKVTDQDMQDEPGGWTEVKDPSDDQHPVNEEMEEVVPDETLIEPAVGKGLSGALKLLKERGSLKETVEWGGRNMDKKKSKLVGIVDDNENTEREIRIERTDEYGRTLTPKEAFRLLSHKFHGKGPGKMKQEKRMKQYQEELKLKQMKNSDTPSLSVERMREAQAQLKTPYLVLSGHVKPGQTSDPRSGFATVEKDVSGGLTPMLGDKKVEHFLGIKRKAEPGNTGAFKKPKA